MNFSLLLLLVYFTYVFGIDEKEGQFELKCSIVKELENVDYKKPLLLINSHPFFFQSEREIQPLYVCPDEKYAENRCYRFIDENERETKPFCDIETYPSLINTKKKCGNGTWYSVQYKICKKVTPEKKEEVSKQSTENENKIFEEKPIEGTQRKVVYSNFERITGTNQKEDDEEDDDDTAEEEREEEAEEEKEEQKVQEEENTNLVSLVNMHSFYELEVFSFCFNKTKKQTSYVKYKPSHHNPNDMKVTTYTQEEIPSKFTAGGYDQFETNLDFMKGAFEKENQKHLLEKIFKEDNKNDDFLIPQQLAPDPHVSVHLSKGLLYKYFNVKPMWNSIKKNWAIMVIRVMTIAYTRSDVDFTVYAGTSGVLKFEDENVNLSADDNSFDVPAVYWMLIKDEKSHWGFILALDNVPVGFRLKKEHKLCKKSVCPFGWDFDGIDSYCCSVNPQRLERFGMPKVHVTELLDLLSIKKKKKGKEQD